MKLIGKNSASKYISWILFGLFLLTGLHFIYEVIGHSILFYKFKTGSDVLDSTFMLGNDVGWAKNKWTTLFSEELKFKINYPFSDRQLVTGFYKPLQIITNIFAFLYFSLLFYFSYRSFREFSSDRVFSSRAVSNLRKLGYINIIFAIMLLLPSLWFYEMSPYALLQFLFIGFFGILILFIVAFFKKGYELQSENDLTI